MPMNVGHAEVPQAPGHHGDDANDAVGVRRSGGDVIGLREAEEAGEGLGVGDDRVHAARLDHAKDHDDGQGGGHDDGLDQVHGGHGVEASDGGIADNDDGPDDHRRHVVPAKEAVEELADGGKARGYIGHEKDQNNQGGNAHDDGLFLPIALGDEAGNGDSVQLHAVAAELFGNQQEVQVGADSQADGGPAGVRHAAEVRKARDAHEQVAAHVGGLGAHGGHQGADAPAAQVEALGALLGAAADHHPGEDDEAEVRDDGTHDADLCGRHEISLLFRSMGAIIAHFLLE